MRTLIIDTETTGLLLPEGAALTDQPHIIELAIVELNEKYKQVGEWEWLINPGRTLPAEITKITGLTDEDLKGKPSFAAILPEVEDVFLGAHRVIAHNLPFDRGMIVNELRRLGREFAFPYPPQQICTAQLSEQYGSVANKNNHYGGSRMRLIELYKFLLKKELKQTHRAMGDVNALVEIVRKAKY